MKAVPYYLSQQHEGGPYPERITCIGILIDTTLETSHLYHHHQPPRDKPPQEHKSRCYVYSSSTTTTTNLSVEAP